MCEQELQIIFQRSEVQIQPPRIGCLDIRINTIGPPQQQQGRSGLSFGGEEGFVAAHVASQRLPHRERHPAYAALMLLRRPCFDIAAINANKLAGLLVAGAVAAQGLERGELPVAGLALEDAAGRRRGGGGRRRGVLEMVADAAGAAAGEEHQAVCHG